MQDNLTAVNISVDQLNSLLDKLNIKTPKDIIVMNLDSNGKLYYQLKGQSFNLIQNINQLNSNKKQKE